MYYFGYGSNMNHKQMNERCPESKFVCRARLGGYRLVYDGKSITWSDMAVANIIQDHDTEVWGGVFSISQSDRNTLDRREGYTSGVYDRKKIEIEGDNGKKYLCYVYLRTGKDEGEPSSEYVETVDRGAQDCGLDKEYIKKAIWQHQKHKDK